MELTMACIVSELTAVVLVRRVARIFIRGRGGTKMEGPFLIVYLLDNL